MPKTILLVAAVLVSSVSLAASSLAKNSTQPDALASAWKAPQSTLSKQETQHGIAMVYGGADIASRPTLA